MKKRTWSVIIVLAACLVVLAACKKSVGTPEDNAQQMRIQRQMQREKMIYLKRKKSNISLASVASICRIRIFTLWKVL